MKAKHQEEMWHKTLYSWHINRMKNYYNTNEIAISQHFFFTLNSLVVPEIFVRFNSR